MDAIVGEVGDALEKSINLFRGGESGEGVDSLFGCSEIFEPRLELFFCALAGEGGEVALIDDAAGSFLSENPIEEL